MKIKAAAITGILALFAIAPAIAQQFPTVTDRSVIGRIGVGGQSGPSQAIPFATLQAQMGIPTMPSVYATTYGVKCDGTTNDAPAAQLAITAAAGRPLIFPAGTCIINSSLTYNTTVPLTFTNGLQIIGQGREKTVFDWRGSGYLFASDTSADNFFQSGVLFKDFKITTTTFPASSSGIKLHRTANAKFENLQFTSLTGDGIVIPASVGDADASFIVEIDRVRMDAIGGWCANLNAPSGGYFGSNLRIVNSSFNGCGTASVSVPPTSGGIQYKGLIAQLVNSAFTVNNNVDFYVQGTDTSMQITIDGTDFENHVSTVLPHVYVDGGLRGFHMMNSECLNNDGHVGQGCVWFNSTSAIIGDITIDKTEVRATAANNTYTAFKITGTNAIVDTMRVGRIYWQTFDLSGQTRFSGFQFNGISGQAQFSISSTNTAVLGGIGYGFTMPMHLAANGEWVEYQISNAGITRTGIGGLTPNTAYYFYLYNSAALNFPYVGAIDIFATAPTTDTISGYFVKTGDTTRTYIGSATTDGSGNFQPGNATSFYPVGGGISINVGAANKLAFYATPTSIGALATANNSILVTDGSGVPSLSTTLPAHTLGGTVSGGGNQINNVIIGASTPLAGSFTTITASSNTTNPFGSGGTTASANTIIAINGSSGSNAGASVTFKRNSVALFAFGNQSGILGGASDDFVIYSNVSGAGTVAAINIQSATGYTQNQTSWGTSVSTTKVTNYTLGNNDSSLIFNLGTPITLTLGAASAFPGRWLYLKNINAAGTVISAASNVVPQAGGAAGTAILAAGTTKWAWVQSDGSSWIIMASN